MKACSRIKKSICWLVLDILPAAESEELLSHLQSCEGCRDYHRALTTITGQLKVEMRKDVQASDMFHRRLMSSLRTEPKASALSLAACALPWPRGWFSWRGAAVVAGSVAAVVLLLAFVIPRPEAPRPAVAFVPPPGLAVTAGVPTLARYQGAAERSLDEFDALLTSESWRSVPGVPVFANLEHAE